MGIQTPAEDVMSLMYWLAAPFALGLFAYLLYALLKAERF
jgi:K+-transporting ATPase KdpF subunit